MNLALADSDIASRDPEHRAVDEQDSVQIREKMLDKTIGRRSRGKQR